jgi:hypothetical protein
MNFKLAFVLFALAVTTIVTAQEDQLPVIGLRPGMGLGPRYGQRLGLGRMFGCPYARLYGNRPPWCPYV